MNPLAKMPLGPMRWPYLQRLAARGWRRWAYALSACSLGLLIMGLAQPELRESHEQAEQAVVRLEQQLAALTVAAAKPPMQALTIDVQRKLASLPAVAQQEEIWTYWQQVLAAHGLRLQSWRPLATESAALPKSASGGADQRASLAHQAAALRLQGRFEDWTRAWAACAETGPLCTIDRISVAALAQASEVQIDVVMRIWMRPAEGDATAAQHKSGAVAGAQAVQTTWTKASSVAPQPRAGPALFAVGVEHLAQSTGAAATGTSVATAAQADLPPDPRHWPLARVRWLGLWQQGGEQQAILSAGTHWAKVSQGQRVTQEGHRVVAITEGGVSLRLAREPVIKLDGNVPAADGHSMGGEKR